MGKDERVGTQSMIWRSGLILFFSLTAAPAYAELPWISSLKSALNQLDAEYPGQLGVYVHDLRSNEHFSFRGEEPWYLASGTKILVAAEILRQIDEGRFSLDTKLVVGPDDFIDGAGALNYAPAGSFHTVRYLLEQMLAESDNTASDLLIRKAGIKKVNALARLNDLNPVTFLSEVRRKVYSQIHPSAAKLKNKFIIELSLAASDQEKLQLLEQKIKVEPGQRRKKSIDAAFAAYYAEGTNSGTLRNYSVFLRRLIEGPWLKASSSRLLVDIMLRCKTGEKRIKAGLGEGLSFAHKTGTQRKRMCDFGIVRRGEKNIAVISACARGFSTTAEGEKALGRLGVALGESGLYRKRSAP